MDPGTSRRGALEALMAGREREAAVLAAQVLEPIYETPANGFGSSPSTR